MSSGLPIDTLGKQIQAHVTKGDAAKDKAEQHYKAAGLHLAEAKDRILGPVGPDGSRKRPAGTKGGPTWPVFLSKHCKLSRSRADELIMIGDGRKTVEEVRAAKNASVKKAYANLKAEAAANSGKSSRIPESDQRASPEPVVPKMDHDDFAASIWLVVDYFAKDKYDPKKLGEALSRADVSTSAFATFIKQLQEVSKYV